MFVAIPNTLTETPMLRSSAFAVALFTSCALAQTVVTETMPAGYLPKSGGSEAHLGRPASLFPYPCYQQIDSTQIGKARTIRALHLRQSVVAGADASRTGSTYEFWVRIGHADWSKVTDQFRAVDEPLIGAWSDVLVQRQISYPDHSKAAPSDPAPWTLRLPFQRPFVYDGKNALFVKIRNRPVGVAQSYSFDAIDTRFTSTEGQGTPVGLGTECQLQGQPGLSMRGYWHTLSDPKQDAKLFAYSKGWPNRTLWQLHPSFLWIGATNPALGTGVCVPLYSSGEIILPLGFLPGTNSRFVEIRVPYRAAWVGKMQVYLQAWGIQLGGPLPVHGSHGYRVAPFPARPVADRRFVAVHAEHQSPAWTRDVVWIRGLALVLGLE